MQEVLEQGGYMVCNVGGIDRIVRILIGIILTASALFFVRSHAIRISLFAVALGSFASAWFGICFINRLLGINTAHPKTLAN